MSDQTAIALVRKLCTEWPTLSRADLHAMLTPDCLYINMPMPQGRCIGPDQTYDLLAAFVGGWNIDMQVLHVQGDTATVLTERLERFTSKTTPGKVVELHVMGRSNFAMAKLPIGATILIQKSRRRCLPKRKPRELGAPEYPLLAKGLPIPDSPTSNPSRASRALWASRYFTPNTTDVTPSPLRSSSLHSQELKSVRCAIGATTSSPASHLMHMVKPMSARAKRVRLAPVNFSSWAT